MEDIYQKIVKVVSEQFECEESSLTPQTRFKEDLKADSISVVELLMAFEDEFGETISDEDSEKIATIQDVVDYIAKR
ncbi:MULTISPECIES: acyl carrier protein [unclassified Granulicatella]|uniref:acyl carrier protein n=1 Tax=unclassified Granulicatella TaxID=2630493 RepID=UPI001073C0C8|nr:MULTISPECIES: acyl carrier protein [unclassified Granulicatella]MBF0779823.1 acyl carrier protein [Granulicatella sp. 19428wC4_WM01]TFU96123.1 acyl carrier protein [Granulicatella sp. WM01]